MEIIDGQQRLTTLMLRFWGDFCGLRCDFLSFLVLFVWKSVCSLTIFVLESVTIIVYI